jgi:ribosome maturation factor RimP
MIIPQELIEEIDACVAREGATVVDMSVRGSWNQRVYEVFVDNKEGVTLDFCAKLSRDILGLLAHRRDAGGQYRLIVSSPGIDRPLKFPWQFSKHVGRLLQIKEPSTDGLRSTSGRLQSCDEHGVTIAFEPTKEQRYFKFEEIREARIKAPW